MEKRVELKDSARFLFAPPKSNVQDAAVKRSKRACKFRQNSGSTPKNAPSRSAVSSEIARLPVIISRTCVAETPKSSASRRSEIPAGFKNSSDKISPGETTSSRFIKRALLSFFLVNVSPFQRAEPTQEIKNRAEFQHLDASFFIRLPASPPVVGLKRWRPTGAETEFER